MQVRPAEQLPRAAGAAARLSFAEGLLAADEAEECADAAVRWLGEHAGARRAVCALLDRESGRIAHVSSHGVPSGQVQGLSVALDQPDHPLIFALQGRDAVELPKNGRRK